MRIIAFLGTVFLVLGGIHAYLWWRMVRNTTRPGRGRRAGTIAAVLLAVLVPATMIGNRVLPTDIKAPLSLVGYLWLAVMFYLLVYLLILEVPRIVAWVIRRVRATTAPVAAQATAEAASVPAELITVPADATSSSADRGSGGDLAGAGGSGGDLAGAGGDPGDRATVPAGGPPHAVADPGRRLFLGRTLAGVAGVAALGTVGYGVRSATGPVPVKRVRVTLDRLPAALDGFTIALLSDIHLSSVTRREYLDGVVRTVNRLDAGLVAIVGDLVDGDVAELGPEAAELRNLESRHGTYFVTGNHEYISGAAQWVDYLPSLGVRVLRNELETISEGSAAFALAGVDDRTAETSGVPGHATDFDAALADRTDGQPVVMLAHQPVLFTEAARREVDLQLSGHTHGGQMVPFNYLVPLDQPWVAGLSRVGGSQLYVTRGVGTWGPPVRVGAPPEITVIELHSP